jgi:hypothetical protein
MRTFRIEKEVSLIGGAIPHSCCKEDNNDETIHVMLQTCSG